MNKNDELLIIILLLLSVAFIIVPIALTLLRRLIGGRSFDERKNPGASKMLAFSACLIFAVWCLRYAVGYYEALIAADSSGVLTWWEEIANSLLHALQTFSMDESYTEYIVAGKAMVRTLVGDNDTLQNLYGAWASILNVAAPIAGGAVVFEMLASIFPKIRLYAIHIEFWRERYYFSELNSASVAVGKSKAEEKCPFYKRPIIIFTDAYVDVGDERSSELQLKAKAFGAICTKDDIIHVTKSRWGKSSYFLIDENEISNLKTLTHLSDNGIARYLVGSNVYLFCSSEAYVDVEQRIKKVLGDKAPTVIPVQRYRNMMANLLVDIPLYEPLLHRADEAGVRELGVVILGTGSIGVEMFLSTYWFCQMLDVHTTVTVVSKESEEEFWSKIDCVNPEIRKTTERGNKLLRKYDLGEECSEPYCSVKYISCDARSQKFTELIEPENDSGIAGADYYLVSLGSDENNVLIANDLLKAVGSRHLSRQDGTHSVITYVVYDSSLASTLNKKRRYDFVKKGSPDIYMRAIGSVDELYSLRSIWMTDHMSAAGISASSHDTYTASELSGRVADEHRARSSEYRGDYKHWSSMARVMHRKYKAFSLGLVEKSIYDYDDDAQEKYAKEQTALIERYRDFVLGKRRIAQNTEEEMRLLNRMSWLEHRRWSAFIRVKGFRSTDYYEKYKSMTGKDHQHWELRLHPTLAECDERGMRPLFRPKNVYWQEALGCPKNSTCAECGRCAEKNKGVEHDRLDGMTVLIGKYDFKLYDYPFADFPEMTVEEAAKAFNVCAETVEKMIAENRLNGAYFCDESDPPTYMIPPLKENIEALEAAARGKGEKRRYKKAAKEAADQHKQ